MTEKLLGSTYTVSGTKKRCYLPEVVTGQHCSLQVGPTQS